MLSVDEGVSTVPSGAAMGCGAQERMSALVCALPKVANVRVPPGW